MSKTLEKLYTIQQACPRMGFTHPNSVRRAIHDKKILAMRRGRRGRWLIPESSIDDYLQGEAPVPRVLAVVTYFIRAGRDGPIKIGRAKHLRQRLKKIQCHNAEEVFLLGYVGGDFEQELHRKFAAFRIRGEWFKPAPEVLAFIEAEAKR